MKDNRFTELVNLCLDHQISPSEAAELEAEILRSPARRREYREYCRLQEGCVRLFQREMTHAPASFALESSILEVERLVSPSPRPVHRRRFVLALAGGVGLAACLTLAFVTLQALQKLESPASLAVATSKAPHQGLARSGDFSLSPAGAPDEYQAVVKFSDWSAPVLATSADVVSNAEWIQVPVLSAISLANFDVTANSMPAPAALDGLNGFYRGNAAEVQNISFQFTK